MVNFICFEKYEEMTIFFLKYEGETISFKHPIIFAIPAFYYLSF